MLDNLFDGENFDNDGEIVIYSTIIIHPLDIKSKAEVFNYG